MKKEQELINKYEEEHNALTEKEKNFKINLKKQGYSMNKLRDEIGNINSDVDEADKKMRELQKKINHIQNELKIKKLEQEKIIRNNKNKDFLSGFKNGQNLSFKKDVIKIRKIKKPFTNDINFAKIKEQRNQEKIQTVSELKKLKNDIEEILNNVNNNGNNISDEDIDK